MYFFFISDTWVPSPYPFPPNATVFWLNTRIFAYINKHMEVSMQLQSLRANCTYSRETTAISKCAV